MIIFKKSNGALILVVSALVILSIGGAIAYYNFDNSSVDPRIADARELYSRYDGYAQENDFGAIFNLLDSIENVYASINHYKHSFETGVLYNNRAAAFLSMALYFDSQSLSLNGLEVLSRDSLLVLCEDASLKSIRIYKQWIGAFSKKSEIELTSLIENDFLLGLDSYSEKQKDRYLGKRVEELIDAQLETPRRLSVAYTNLGIALRHQEKYEEAIEYYKLAMDLWDRNLAAENNLNLLLGRPMKKQNMIEKLFPPDKSKQ